MHEATYLPIDVYLKLQYVFIYLKCEIKQVIEVCKTACSFSPL